MPAGCSLDGAIKLNHGLTDIAVNWSGERWEGEEAEGGEKVRKKGRGWKKRLDRTDKEWANERDGWMEEMKEMKGDEIGKRGEQTLRFLNAVFIKIRCIVNGHFDCSLPPIILLVSVFSLFPFHLFSYYTFISHFSSHFPLISPFFPFFSFSFFHFPFFLFSFFSSKAVYITLRKWRHLVSVILTISCWPL